MLERFDLAKRTNFLVFAAVLSYLVLQLIFEFALGREWIEKYIYFFLAFIQLLVILLPALLFVKRHKMSYVEVFRLNGISIPEILIIIPMAVLSGIIASVLNAILIYFLGKNSIIPTGGVPIPENVSELIVQIVVVALIPSVCEEIFFRGVIYHAFSGMGVWKAIIVTALYFSLFHFDLRNFLGPFFLGILIAWYCHRTGSIFSGVIAHLANNLMFVLINWFGRNTGNEPLNLTPGNIKALVYFSVLAGIVLALLIKAFTALTRNKTRSSAGNNNDLPLSVIIQWPMCFFYVIYIVITGMLLST